MSPAGPTPALPVGIWEKSSCYRHSSVHLSIRACSGVAVSPLWQGVAVAEPVLAFLWHWAASAMARCHPPYPVDLGGLLAFLLSVFFRAACGCTTEIVVLQSLRFPEHLCVSRLEKTKEAERKRRVCV